LSDQNRQATAKIYQFPVRRREGVERPGFAQGAGLAYKVGSFATPSYGGAWYHDVAIREEDQSRKR
jgi:hypothetical protein